MSRVAAKAAFAEAYSQGQRPRRVTLLPSGQDELWAIGSCAFIVPIVPPNASPELEYAIRLRRDALTTGQCDHCGATPDLLLQGLEGPIPTAAAFFPHRQNCLAADHLAGTMLQSHWNSERKRTLQEQFHSASAVTREKLRLELGDRAIAGSELGNSWLRDMVESLFDAEATTVCPHLSTHPAQTWHALIAEGTWRCSECWEAFRQGFFAKGPVLTPIEEHTCDVCRRFVGTMSPLVGRLDHLVLHGGVCRRCMSAFSTLIDDVAND